MHACWRFELADQRVSKVLGLALRSAPRGPMREVHEVTAVANAGLVDDVASRPDRGVTFLSAAQWRDVQRELGTDIPWHTRRANVLVDLDGLSAWIGHTIRVGSVVVQVLAETKPCDLMDRMHPGLKAALAPELRGGVHGRIVQGGRIAVGDAITVSTE